MLTGKRVVVTGGSRGLGKALVRAALAHGSRVFTCYRSPDTDFEAELAASKRGRVVRADITSPGGVQILVDACRAEWGQVDILVNNVGVDGQRSTERLDEAEWNRVLDTNLTSGYAVVRGMLPLLSDGASIINIGASAALRGRPASAHYTASKSALIGLTKSLSRELAGRQIRINVVSPGIIEPDGEHGMPPQVRERLLASVPLGRFAAYDDVVGPVLFLASDWSTYVTGQNLLVDGGM